MANGRGKGMAPLLCIVCVLFLNASGCHAPQIVDAPTELTKVAHPDYTIGPPDILLIDAANLIPRPPYKVAALDGLLLRVTVTAPKEGQKPNELLPGQPIDGLYRVEVGGEVNLGFDFGSVNLAGKTIPESKDAIEKHLKERFKGFSVLVALVESRALQQIRGEHLVTQDGMVRLGIYGSVFVSGLTVEQAKAAIEAHLSHSLFEPAVSIDVVGYNSKVYYVIVDLGSAGKQVIRLPITGNETVLDALGQIKGLPPGTDASRIQVARRSPIGEDYTQVMPVDWQAIVHGGSTATNYQLMPGDRVLVNVDRWVALDQTIAKMISPFERLFGVALLGHTTVQAFANPLVNPTTTTTTTSR